MTTDLREQLQATLGAAYTLERELGGGGMSRVFVAHESRLDRRVVVKVLHPDLAAGLSATRFEREVRLVARLQHPHVVPLLNAGELKGLPYYTMPYVEGESLRVRLMREGALPLTDAMRLVREMADALAYAHEQGVVHRDLKPENVLLSGGHAVVADFGIAKALASATQEGEITEGRTALGMVLGTPAYMAPEQAAADPSTDHRADLYALGLIAYEVLSGRHPFAGRASQAMLAAQMTETPAPLSAGRPDISASLAALVMHLLAKRADERPSSARAVLMALDDLATPVAGGRMAPGRPKERRRGYPRVAAGLVLALGAVGAAFVWRSHHAPPPTAGAPTSRLVERRVAVSPFENQTGDSAFAALGHLASDWIAQGLAQADFAEVVDPQTVRSAWQPTRGAVGLGSSTGARIVVSGSYYRDGDSLRFLARIIDAEDGKLLLAIDPVGASTSKTSSGPGQALAVVRERVLGALASHFDARIPLWSIAASMPPSLAAYRKWSTGLDKLDQGDFRGAISESRAAWQLDSTYLQPLLLEGLAHMILGEHSAADSLHQRIARKRDRLSPAERHLLGEQRAENRGDWSGALVEAREYARLTPGGYHGLVLVGWQADQTNRPREALSALKRAEAEHKGMRLESAYWQALANAWHLTGDYASELEAVRRGRAIHQDDVILRAREIRALGALGRLAEAEQRLDEMLDLPPESTPPPEAQMMVAGRDLRAHGHQAVAQAAFTRALQRFERRPAEARRTPDARRLQAGVLYEAGRWEDSRRILEGLAVDDSAKPYYRGALGILAARRGDRVAALAADTALAELRGPFLLGVPSYMRARIAALLGDRDRAVALLAESVRQGVIPIERLHSEMDFASLQDHPAFRELVRLKD